MSPWCDSPWTRFHAGHCGGRGVPCGSRPRPCQFRRPVSWWRALRAWGTPGRIRPGADMSPRATDWQLHAREPLVPARCGSSHRQRSLPAAWGHATLSDATRWPDQLHSRCVIRGRALPRRGATRQPHPGWPRLRRSQVNATHRTTRRALIMSAARHKMLSTPCRARLRAARHYRIAPPGDRPRKATSAASGRRPVVTVRSLTPRARTSRSCPGVTVRPVSVVSPRLATAPGLTRRARQNERL